MIRKASHIQLGPFVLSSRNEQCRRRSGLAMVEVVVCTMLVGTLLLTSLRTLGAVYRFRGENTDEQRGVLLAEELLSRIELLPYNDPDGGSILGREFFEQYFGAPFDDMNDFHNYTESPPEDENGAALPGFEDWSWSVQFSYVNPAELSTSFLDQGAMISTLVIQRNNVTVASLKTLHVDSRIMEIPR